MKKRLGENGAFLAVLGAMLALGAAFAFVLWHSVPQTGVRLALLSLMGGMGLAMAAWGVYTRRQVTRFAGQLCETLDALLAGQKPKQGRLYEDTLENKVEGKLLQYYEIMRQAREQSLRDKTAVQEIVSDISHQVKTPIANAKMFTGILRQHELAAEKREEFLGLLEAQIDKLDFLMQSLIKMSRLETGTFALKMAQTPIYSTIAMAVDGVWAKADGKNITLEINCDSGVLVKHDPKWTAEALGNLLDNAVKYTPPGGAVTVTVQPWQFYTRIDITDTGIGIPEQEYHNVFKRFYRAQAVAAQEGVGLGLYLAQSIIQLQKGYISVKSVPGQGATFSVHLLS